MIPKKNLKMLKNSNTSLFTFYFSIYRCFQARVYQKVSHLQIYYTLQQKEV
jgi:hypothetical protein